MPLTAAYHLRRAPTRSCASGVWATSAPQHRSSYHHWLPAQMLFFRAAAGKAFTIFRAGFAFTITTLPNISLLPAFVAGFVRVFNPHKPGREKTPVLPTTVVAIEVKLSMTFEHTDFLSSHEVASASAIAPFDIGLAAIFTH